MCLSSFSSSSCSSSSCSCSSSSSSSSSSSPPPFLYFLKYQVSIKANLLLISRLLYVRLINANLALNLTRPVCIICALACNFHAHLVMFIIFSFLALLCDLFVYMQ